MSARVDRLNMEFEILKRNVRKTENNLLEEWQKRGQFDANISKLFSILDCSIDQTNALFKLARGDGEVEIMKNIIKDNFGHERQIIQKIAIRIYGVTRANALEIIYDMWRRSIEDDLTNLHLDFEHLVQTCSTADMYDDPDYLRVPELFSDQQKDMEIHDAIFQEAKDNNDVNGMHQSIANDIPQELTIIQRIRDTISRLQSK